MVRQLDDLVFVLVGGIVIDNPYIGIRLVHRGELHLFLALCRGDGKVDQWAVDPRIVFLDLDPLWFEE